MMEPIIKIEKLNVAYFLGRSNEVRALKDINLEIYPGEFIIFFGPSGCGKSTLLYSVAGLETNIQGNIYIGGKNLIDLKFKELEVFHQKEIGMIFQAYYLINSLSVLDNVLLPQIFLNEKQEARKRSALALLEHFGVKPQANKLPTELSGGQQQRVAICRALINDPTILLADEPIGNLDSTSAQDVMNLIRDLNEKQKKTVILVTHNPSHLNFAHRVFYMRDGSIIETRVNRAVGAELPLAAAAPAVAVSREMELLLRTYSSLSAAQVGNLLIPFKAKQIVAEVLIGMTSEDVGRIEKKVENLLMQGINDNDETLQFLDIDASKGGMGLDRRTAGNLTEKVKDIIKEIKLLEKDEEEMRRGHKVSISGEAMKIRHYLFDHFEARIKDFASLEIADRAIKDRVANKIDKKMFQDRLSLPLTKGGAGVNKRTAKKMAQRLELLILGKYK
ncbi:ABC transporter ATP-binding protein [Candidatus Falkowbacteria bacterium]|nr:ABC transporter ATP-binding protein [Candidatus Falkowbacteria bacterium]